MSRDRTTAANLLLIGPRASGKSTVGGVLAQQLRWRFIDLDLETLAAFPDSPSISIAWRVHGEPAWRMAEAAALARVLQAPAQVVALGGGTPMIPQSKRLLVEQRQTGAAYIVYLQADPNLLRERLRDAAGDRPPLKGSNAIDEVEQILREREPTYLGLADLVVAASADVNDIATTIAAAFGAMKSAAPGQPTADR